MSKVTLICKNCNKPFDVYFYRKDTAEYCSKRCHSDSFIGNIPWNKGLTKETDKRVKSNSDKQIGRIASKETKQRLSESHMGQKAWNKGLNLTEEHKKNVSISCKKVASDPNDKRHSIEWRKQLAEITKLRIANGEYLGAKKSKYTLKTGKTIFLRSNTELTCIKILEDLGVEFQYETLKIKYKGIDNETHTWITDFYFPKYNLIIDTKYGDYYKDYSLGLKINTAKSLGYRVLIVDFELYNGNPEPSLIMKIITEGVETIPKGSRVINYVNVLEVPSPIQQKVVVGEEIVHSSMKIED